MDECTLFCTYLCFTLTNESRRFIILGQSVLKKEQMVYFREWYGLFAIGSEYFN